MDRLSIIRTIGEQYLVSNIENNEFSYLKGFQAIGKDFNAIKKTNSRGRAYKTVDMRFVSEERKVAVLVETKANFDRDPEASFQLDAYVQYEKELSGYAIIGILANTNDNRIKVWKERVSDTSLLIDNFSLKSFDEYVNIVRPPHRNDKELVMRNTYKLNEILHGYGINEKLRSQFVGTCILALKNNLQYVGNSTPMIIAGIKNILAGMLSRDTNNDNRAAKIRILDNKVLGDQDVVNLKDVEFIHILNYIKDNILNYINDTTALGQDLLNLFFTTFNKYVGKTDKNQAFTPDHIVSFMCDIVGITRYSKVLDPCCGSGAFLVRALTEALGDCQTEEERNNVKNNNIYGIEYEDGAFGLSTTNMLIHGDGNSNVIQGSCFDKDSWITQGNIDRVLMNPPYNAQKKFCKSSYVATWDSKIKEDPSKGLHYVLHIANLVNRGKLAVLLPMQCAISDNNEIRRFKELMLQNHHLDAVFSLPNEIFYPGASAVACCMIFDLGVRHENAPIKETFFGYCKDDGFYKKKKIGRIEKIDENGESLWEQIKNKWITLYRTRLAEAGYSALRTVGFTDEWCAEAYMETNYATLKKENFIRKMRDFATHKVQTSNPNLPFDFTNKPLSSTELPLDVSSWRYFRYDDIFDIKHGFYNKKPDEVPNGDIPFIGATDSNNGITSFHDIEAIEVASKTGDESNSPLEDKLFEPNCITVSNNGSVGYAFYQQRKFTCTHDVNPLYLRHRPLTVHIAMFLCTLIEKEQFRWDYGRKWRPKRMPSSLIKLPVTTDGSPDWEYMENYIKGLPYSRL